jgi:hypothetical protein
MGRWQSLTAQGAAFGKLFGRWEHVACFLNHIARVLCFFKKGHFSDLLDSLAVMKIKHARLSNANSSCCQQTEERRSGGSCQACKGRSVCKSEVHL